MKCTQFINPTLFKIPEITSEYVLVLDISATGNYSTITNNPQDVISQLSKLIEGGINHRRIYYLDSYGERLDEIIYDAETMQFVDFNVLDADIERQIRKENDFVKLK